MGKRGPLSGSSFRCSLEGGLRAEGGAGDGGSAVIAEGGGRVDEVVA